MSALFLDGRQIGDDGRNAGPLPVDLMLAKERASEIRRERLAQTWSEIGARMDAAATALMRGRGSIPSRRARRYRDEPSRMPPCRDLEARARAPFGKVQIVPVPQINAAAGRILARWQRRFGEHAASTAAERADV